MYLLWRVRKNIRFIFTSIHSVGHSPTHSHIHSLTKQLFCTLFCQSVSQLFIIWFISIITIYENSILWIYVCWTLGESVFENVAISQSKHAVFQPFRTRTRPKHETMIFIVSWLNQSWFVLCGCLSPRFWQWHLPHACASSFNWRSVVIGQWLIDRLWILIWVRYIIKKWEPLQTLGREYKVIQRSMVSTL